MQRGRNLMYNKYDNNSLDWVSAQWLYFVGVLTYVWRMYDVCLDVMYHTRKSVYDDIQTPKRELKIRRIEVCFWRSSRCLQRWTNTVLSVRYIFSIETKTKEKAEKENRLNLCLQCRGHTWWIINEFKNVVASGIWIYERSYIWTAEEKM